MSKLTSFEQYKKERAIDRTKALLEDNYFFVNGTTYNVPGCCIEFTQLTKYKGQDWIMFMEAWVPATISQAQALIKSIQHNY